MNLDALASEIRNLDSSLAQHAASAVNASLSIRNWLIGAYLVEFEQKGEDRAKYGERLIPELAKRLKIKGLSTTILRHCRTFYILYPTIHQSLTGEFSQLLDISTLPIYQSATDESSEEGETPHSAISDGAASSSSLSSSILRAPARKILTQLSFTHLVELLKIDDPLKRAFYEIEAIKGRWSVRTLKRQIGSLLFERTGLSKDKEKLIALTNEQAVDLTPRDLIRDPYIFEFLGLRPKETVEESDLETALLNHLQAFLLELGRGFCFEQRQRKILIDADHYFVDLVFYHRILKCHVLIDLKVEPFSHANAGQLNTYLNWFKEHEMQSGDQPPVGLLLRTDRKAALAKYALGGMDENLFVSQYQVQLPSTSEIETFLRNQEL